MLPIDPSLRRSARRLEIDKHRNEAVEERGNVCSGRRRRPFSAEARPRWLDWRSVMFRQRGDAFAERQVVIAPLRLAIRLPRCPFIGVDRKWRAHGQDDANDPNVWSGRVLQCMVRPRVARGFRRSGSCGLASMYPASGWSVLCSGPSWISARMRSDSRSGLDRGHLGHQCSHAPGRPILHPRLILSQTSAG